MKRSVYSIWQRGKKINRYSLFVVRYSPCKRLTYTRTFMFNAHIAFIWMCRTVEYIGLLLFLDLLNSVLFCFVLVFFFYFSIEIRKQTFSVLKSHQTKRNRYFSYDLNTEYWIQRSRSDDIIKSFIFLIFGRSLDQLWCFINFVGDAVWNWNLFFRFQNAHFNQIETFSIHRF